jgi:hypothetical protein
VEIDASAPASRLIERRGGKLYVWFGDLRNSPWATQRVAFRAPEDVDFSRYFGDAFELYLDSRFAPPGKLNIRRRPWPIGPIEVTGTGAGDGWADGGGGGGGDGWPASHGGSDGGGGGHGGHGGH